MIPSFSFFILTFFAFSSLNEIVNCKPIHPNSFTKRQSKYPPILQPADPNYLPQDWKDSLTAATNAGKIPNIPQSTLNADGTISYSGNVGFSQDTCSWTTIKCYGENDVKQSPDGIWIVAFDDGPTNASPDLYSFLQSQNQSATHFMIGSNIVQNQQIVKQADSTNQELGVHTWSHNVMTTLSNEVILGELGWTMQIIYDLTGKVPTTWRPPQGDIDNRVRAIAENVFGLTAVMWDAECNDWCLNDNGGSSCPNTVPGNTYDSVVQAVNQAIQKPKSPGVILLEHELTSSSVGIFKNAFSQIKQAGWNPKSVSDALNKDWYTNAENGTAIATPIKGMTVSENEPPSEETTTTTTSSSTATSSATVSNQATSLTTSSTITTTTATSLNKQANIHTGAAKSTFIVNAPTMIFFTSLMTFFTFSYLII